MVVGCAVRAHSSTEQTPLLLYLYLFIKGVIEVVVLTVLRGES
jgi:hypothetical protein